MQLTSFPPNETLADGERMPKPMVRGQDSDLHTRSHCSLCSFPSSPYLYTHSSTCQASYTTSLTSTQVSLDHLKQYPVHPLTKDEASAGSSPKSQTAGAWAWRASRRHTGAYVKIVYLRWLHDRAAAQASASIC